MSRRWRYPRQPRGQFLWVPPTAVTPPAPPAYPPGFIRQTIRRVLFIRRGSVLEAPGAQPTQPPAPASIRRRVGSVTRRGRFQWVPPLAPVTGGPGPLVQPPYREAIRRGFLARRGHFWYVPLVGGAPITPTAWPPPIITARRHHTYPTRRRATFPAPIVQSRSVPYQTCRRTPVRSTRRGEFFQPPWLQIITTPPTYPPQRIVARRRPIPRPRGMHCRFFEPGWPQAETSFVPGSDLYVANRTVDSIRAASRETTGIDTASRTFADVNSRSRDTADLTPDDRKTSTLTGG